MQVIRVWRRQLHEFLNSNYLLIKSFVGSEEPSLNLLRSAEFLHKNSSPFSNCQRSKLAVFISRNINYNINSLLL